MNDPNQVWEPVWIIVGSFFVSFFFSGGEPEKMIERSPIAIDKVWSRILTCHCISSIIMMWRVVYIYIYEIYYGSNFINNATKIILTYIYIYISTYLYRVYFFSSIWILCQAWTELNLTLPLLVGCTIAMWHDPVPQLVGRLETGSRRISDNTMTMRKGGGLWISARSAALMMLLGAPSTLSFGMYSLVVVIGDWFFFHWPDSKKRIHI